MTACALVLLGLVVISLAFAARYARLEGQRAREVAWLRRRLSSEEGDHAAAAREVEEARKGYVGGAESFLESAYRVEKGSSPCA